LVVKLALLITLIGGTQASDLIMKTKQSVEGIDDNQDSEEDEPEQFSLDNIQSQINEENRGSGKRKRSHSPKKPSPSKATNEAMQSRRRVQSHILLVGDPGTGKSQFLRFAAALSPRSVLTTGVGTTSAGLTCAAVKEVSNTYTLEAGALVLADRGVCCIDEFGCIRAEDRNNIHEAMEQQTLSVAKAGIVCKLNTRATVVAVMNPKGSLYSLQDSVSKNTNIGTALLSRFDLIFVLLDSSDIERDDKITSFLLNHAIQGCGYEVSTHSSSKTEQYWSMEKLRLYIACVKEKFQPVLSPEAVTLLQRHYQRCREYQEKSSIHITVRFLESLIRLSQAHARLMYRNTVELQDAVAVILIMECSAATSGGLQGDGYSMDDPTDYLFHPPMQSEFPSDEEADDIFKREQGIVLKRYNMLNYLKSENQAADSYTMSKYDDCWGRTHLSPKPTQSPAKSILKNLRNSQMPSGGPKDDESFHDDDE